MSEGTLYDSSLARVGEARLLDPAASEWAEVLRRAGHDIYHDPGYVVLDARVTGGTAAAFWYREESAALLLPLIVRGVPDSELSDAISPYGYPGPISDAAASDTGFWERASRAMAETLRAHGIVTAFVRLHPLLPVPLDALGGVGLVVRHGETVSADLSLTDEEIWQQTRRDHRNHINRAKRAGLAIVMDDWARLDEWIAVYHGNMRRLEASEYYFFPADHLAALHDTLGDRMHLAVALADGEVIGGNTFFEYRGICQGYISSTRREENHYADKLLYDHVRRWAGTRGNTVFHFGGGVGGAKDSLFSYKAGFSAGRHAFHTWRVVTDPVAYRALVSRGGAESHAGFDAEGMSGNFPPYRYMPRPLSRSGATRWPAAEGDE
jgi:hypothetical protein